MRNKKILIVQRVITSYRLDLLKELCNEFEQVGIITSKGEPKGTLKRADYAETESKTRNLKVYELNALKIGYKGESRSTSLFFYPQVVKYIFKYDILLLEGTTNIFNNIYLVPLAKILKKKTVWWDSGYSEEERTFKRKTIDFFIKPIIKLTDFQMAYSSKGKEYLESYMGANNAFLNLNTINTDYFKKIEQEVENSIKNYQFNNKNIKLLYVGVVEKRKKIEELILVVQKLNQKVSHRKFNLNIIGGGKQLNELRIKYSDDCIAFHGPIYDKENLKQFYFNSDLFVLPGDGGLAILQSLLYGLPVLCIKGADGTERDYILEESFLLNSISEIQPFIKRITNIDRFIYLDFIDKVSSKNWINTLITRVN